MLTIFDKIGDLIVDVYFYKIILWSEIVGDHCTEQNYTERMEEMYEDLTSYC